MARSEVQTTIRRIRRQLHSGHRLEYAELADDIDESVDTLTFVDPLPKSVTRGSVLEIGIEQMRVRDADSGGRTAVVKRGYADSEAVAHDDGEEITVNARFSNLDIYDALVAELNSWGPGIFRVESAVLDYALGSQTIELPVGWAGFWRILHLRGQTTGPNWLTGETWTKWPEIGGNVLSTPVATLPDALTSGLLLRIPQVGFEGKLYVAVAMPLLADEVPLTADLIEDVGMPASCVDLLDLGVKRRLAYDAEHGRSARDAQGDSRDASENPPGSNVAVLRVMDAQYFRRMSEETWKLLHLYPPRMD